ncbi:TlpA family protein disulfide reductase [Pseudoduganella violacea]|uniref:Thiol-disulfide isomerase/thioredoxin n=1 Tax=Pseudoduganella violacea TaxID=1715466 RepID=A0A7W5BCD9_9BURK|nr:TlpA disulfide reductase family protein [Pseudoduganella violacea]MBB3120534.1 thiol-disulfide isomerase/thioredoxin [Pseudoduganella violacea]
MKKKTLLAYSVIAVLFAAAGAWVGVNKKPPAPPITHTVQPGVTGPVQALFSQTMADAAGSQQALSQWKGKTLVVNFWAPWCGPCVQEMPELSELQTASSGKNLQIIGIGIDSPANIAEFAKKFHIAYPVYVAGIGGTELSRQFGNQQGGLPYTVLIGPDGEVKKTYLGRLKFDQLRADLAAM